jgi:V8-like Glu-specific endopeptidase
MAGSPLPTDWKKSVILLEERRGDTNNPIGTGFLVEYKTANVLLTCRHVVFDSRSNKLRDIVFAHNSKTGSVVRRAHSDIQKGPEWVFHPSEEVDLAATLFGYDPQAEEPLRVGPDLWATTAEVEEGEDLLYLGFPLGLRQMDKIRPVVRSGVVALVLPDENLLIDASVSPGNSGSPVFLKPSVIDWKAKRLGTISPAKLVGLVTSSLQVPEVATSETTGRPRVVFEENSGLAEVVGCHYFNELFASTKFEDQYARFVTGK